MIKIQYELRKLPVCAKIGGGRFEVGLRVGDDSWNWAVLGAKTRAKAERLAPAALGELLSAAAARHFELARTIEDRATTLSALSSQWSRLPAIKVGGEVVVRGTIKELFDV